MIASENQQPSASSELEVAHVLFIDLVGYSRLALPDQKQLTEELQTQLRAAPAFQQAEASKSLICLPTGDGVALSFFRDPVAPVECALQIARSAHGGPPRMRLRMGLHSGLVYRVRDINGHENVSGDGMNTAQRLMDLADAGHILLSGVMADMLRQVSSDWPPRLLDLGEAEVKHGQRLRVFNLVLTDASAGNPAPPERMTRRRVVLLYKRDAEPDGALMRLLESGLTRRGFFVFIDRRLPVGVEWAREIERQIREADAVIPLVSAASAPSEMMTHEVLLARDAASAAARTGESDGRPRLLPVRVGDPGPLPPDLAAVLAPLQHASWNAPADDERLLAELAAALQEPAAVPEAADTRAAAGSDKSGGQPVGGAVPLDSRFWVVRPTEGDLKAAIARQDSIVLLKGARQMGKTSLLARGLAHARNSGIRCIHTDFQKLNAAHLESVEAFFLALGGLIADQLDLDVLPDEVWSARRGANANFERYLRKAVFAGDAAPVVWAMDEVDRLFTCPFASEVFGLFRSWHNERSLDPTGPWSRLTLAIAYATEAHLFITDMNQSPFNVGTRLTLEDFTPAQVADLNQRYGAPLGDADAVGRFCGLVGGQPYLVQKGLSALASSNKTIAVFEQEADRDEGLFGDHLRRFLVLLARDEPLSDALREILRGHPCPSAEAFYRLRTAGLLMGDTVSEARPRCRIYASYFSRHLLP